MRRNWRLICGRNADGKASSQSIAWSVRARSVGTLLRLRRFQWLGSRRGDTSNYDIDSSSRIRRASTMSVSSKSGAVAIAR